MGGGGAMRAAAKVAGLGVVNSGLRGVPAVSPAEHPFTAAARKATRSVSANVSSSEDVQLNGLVASQKGKIDASGQRPCWEIDDWEFAGGEKDLIVESGESMPRVVFGGVPTLQETKEATSELKEALEMAYLSPKPTGRELLSNSDCLETKASATSESTITTSVPKHAIQAFRFLNKSSAAQNVVASIACDPNVWKAVMQNEAVVGFLESQKTSVPFSEMDPNVKESDATAAKSFDEMSDSRESASGNWFTDYLQNIKVTVVEMMSSLSNYFQNLFGSPEEEVPAEADGSSEINFLERAMGASFMGLAVMVIMVVVLKRG